MSTYRLVFKKPIDNEELAIYKGTAKIGHARLSEDSQRRTMGKKLILFASRRGEGTSVISYDLFDYAGEQRGEVRTSDGAPKVNWKGEVLALPNLAYAYRKKTFNFFFMGNEYTVARGIFGSVKISLGAKRAATIRYYRMLCGIIVLEAEGAVEEIAVPLLVWAYVYRVINLGGVYR